MEHTDTGHENFKFSIPDENQSPPSSERFKFEPAIEDDEDLSAPAVVKVIGVGGGGGNVLSYMADSGLCGVEFIAANTDIQDLRSLPDSIRKLQLGTPRRRGLGAGMNPSTGEAAAKESITEIEDALDDANLVFIIACLGGGTGSGAAPVISEVAKEKDILTVAIVTLPLMEEQIVRKRNAEICLRDIHGIADSVVVIPNDKLCKVVDGSMGFSDAFNEMNDFLAESVKGVADVINTAGLWNLDYKDVESVLASNGDGVTLIGKGIATGQNRAENAVRAALNSPLMEDTDLSGARSVLYNVRANDLSFDEARHIMRIFNEIMIASGGSGGVFPGIVDDPTMGEQLEITVLLTGVDRGVNSPSTLEVDTHQRDSHTTRERPKVYRPEPRIEEHVKPSQNVPEEQEGDRVISGGSRTISRPAGRRLNTSDIPALFRDQAD